MVVLLGSFWELCVCGHGEHQLCQTGNHSHSEVISTQARGGAEYFPALVGYHIFNFPFGVFSLTGKSNSSRVYSTLSRPTLASLCGEARGGGCTNSMATLARKLTQGLECDQELAPWYPSGVSHAHSFVAPAGSRFEMLGPGAAEEEMVGSLFHHVGDVAHWLLRPLARWRAVQPSQTAHDVCKVGGWLRGADPVHSESKNEGHIWEITICPNSRHFDSPMGQMAWQGAEWECQDVARIWGQLSEATEVGFEINGSFHYAGGPWRASPGRGIALLARGYGRRRHTTLGALGQYPVPPHLSPRGDVVHGVGSNRCASGVRDQTTARILRGCVVCATAPVLASLLFAPSSMALNAVQHEWVIQHAEFLLTLAGSFPLDGLGGQTTIKDAYMNDPAGLAEFLKGKKKSGSDEALASHFIKAMTSLQQVLNDLEKRNPGEFRDLIKKVDKVPLQFCDKVLAVPPPEREVPAPESDNDTNDKFALMLKATRAKSKAYRREELHFVPETHAVVSPLALAQGNHVFIAIMTDLKRLMKKFKFIIFVIVSFMIGIMGYALHTEPGLGADLIVELLLFLPDMFDYMLREVLGRLKFRALVRLDQSLGGRLGYLDMKNPRAQSRARPVLPLPASAEPDFIYLYVLGYSSACFIVWRYYVK